ncbi:type II secretion system protein [Nitratiruptor sp. SB155-2]|uniref:type II secretion system protein n=1 Tax=Nitratiruptor sp. (strain SB155-2) TaxID=387092 RepID=UPI0001587285|nr:type II secretion system protein [Nitratiruptor sp. SB155-2]BAF70678.1 hypothetical protein NIS_1571 [Nitratiruptor sp. SB155-2]
MKRSFTLLEIIVVLVIVSLLSVATFKALSKIVQKSFKAKETTKLSLESQIVLDQISNLLADRIPATTIGYDPVSGDYKPLNSIDSDNYKILEWYVRAMDDYMDGHFSGFCDMIPSIDTNNYVVSYGFEPSNMYYASYNLIFAGSFDRATSDISDFQNAFGWHGGGSLVAYDISLSDSNSSAIALSDARLPNFVYEKYFLTIGAHAIARGADIDKSASCLDGLHIDENTLLLFYDYYPWQGQTFCADPNGTGQSGKAAVLMRYVQGFFAAEQDYTVRLKLDVNRTIRGLGSVHFSKQKVVF